MKIFNKDKALRQIKLKQNKNTYIKKISIVLSCFILLVGIMYFTFAKFEQNSEEYTLINGVVKYGGSGDIQLSYVVDGVSQSVPPAKGTGYIIKNVNCINADGIWLSDEWSFKASNITGKVKCNLEFEEAQYNNVTKWLATANINKNYTTLSEVFNDTETLSTLTNNETSCDYLDNSTDWINEVTSNENAMTYLGNNDYCADSLYFDENWKDAIIDSTYWDKVLKPLIPTMSSNTEPSGECFSNRSVNVSYAPWKAFNNGDGYWQASTGGATAVDYVGYKFPKAINAKVISIGSSVPMSIEASNDGSNWTTLGVDGKRLINTESYLYYRARSIGSSGAACYVWQLQFYGR